MKAAQKTASDKGTTRQAPAPTRTGREPILSPETIDRFCPLLDKKRALDAQLRVLTAEGGEFDTLNREIREHTDQNYPANVRVMLHGRRYDLEATPKENEATPDWKRLIRDFGMKLVLQFASISKRAVKELLASLKRPEAECEDYFAMERTGARKLTVVAKTPPSVEEAA